MTNLISLIFGYIANIKFPSFIQELINKAYIKAFKIDMQGFKSPKEYESLNALFTRSFVEKKEIISAENDFLSPSDGLCLECGSACGLVAFSIKERKYLIDELLGSSFESFKSGYKYINIYLSPKDYHHYHAPCDMEILSSLYIPAKLLSVSPKILLKFPKVYTQNERVILKCRAKNQIFWIVFVGALNVGKMKFDFDENIQTNANRSYELKSSYKNLFIKKGEHLGNFELGSTIVIITENKFVNFNISRSQNIKFGQKIGEIL